MLRLLFCTATLLLFACVCSPLATNDVKIRYDNTYCRGDGDNNVTRDDQYCNGFWSNASNHIDSIYARGLSLDDVRIQKRRRGGSLPGLNSYRLSRVFERLLDTNDVIHVHVMGGSMTAGRNVQGYRGAWPAVFEEMWRKGGGNFSRIIVHNHALGGTGTHWLLNNLGLLFTHGTPIDVVVIDYDINDMVLWTSSSEHTIDLLSTLELAIYRILLLEERPAVVYFNVATTHRRMRELVPECREYITGWQLVRLKEVVAHYLDVPIVSQRQALWSNFSCPAPRELWDCPGSFCSHPLHKAHRFMASLLVYFFQRRANETSPSPPFPVKANESEIETDRALVKELVGRPFLTNKTHELDASKCFHYLSEADNGNMEQLMAELATRRDCGANSSVDRKEKRENYSSSNNAILVSKHYCWQYYSDMPGKPQGMINHSLNCSNTSMHFRMRFGEHGTLSLTYMRTYNVTAGLAVIEVSRPLTPGELELPNSFIPNSQTFTQIGVIDALHEDPDNGQGHSLIWPTVFQSPLLVHSTAVVRISIQDANADPYRSKYNSGRAGRVRVDPQKIKINSIGSC